MVSAVLVGTAANEKELRLDVWVVAVEEFADPMKMAVAPMEAPPRRNFRRDIVILQLRRKSVSFPEFWVMQFLQPHVVRSGRAVEKRSADHPV